jgi:hypothetical protein
LILITIKHHHSPYWPFGKFLTLSAALDLMGVILAFNYCLAYKRLSARITEGGPEAVFLDRIRCDFAWLGPPSLLLIISVVALTLAVTS